MERTNQVYPNNHKYEVLNNSIEPFDKTEGDWKDHLCKLMARGHVGCKTGNSTAFCQLTQNEFQGMQDNTDDHNKLETPNCVDERDFSY